MTHINSATTKPVSVALVGARGYAGLELARLLLAHPAVKLREAYATSEFNLGQELWAPGADQVICQTQAHVLASEAPIVYLATPAEVSHDLAPALVRQGRKVIDLSGAFRLQKQSAEPWYGFSNQNLGVQVDYGLLPFCGNLRPGTNLVANPGCYATAVALALIPLLKHDLINKDTIAIDAKSGTTGAGRKASENLLFSEVDGQCQPYRVGRHQHLPEIQEAIADFAGVGELGSVYGDPLASRQTRDLGGGLCAH